MFPSRSKIIGFAQPDDGRIEFLGRSDVITSTVYYVRIAILVVNVLEKVSSYLILGALVQQLRFRSPRWRPSWMAGSKWCRNVKRMSGSESSWLTYPKKFLHTCFSVLWFKSNFLSQDNASGHFRFGPLAENARIS